MRKDDRVVCVGDRLLRVDQSVKRRVFRGRRIKRVVIEVDFDLVACLRECPIGIPRDRLRHDGQDLSSQVQGEIERRVRSIVVREAVDVAQRFVTRPDHSDAIQVIHQRFGKAHDDVTCVRFQADEAGLDRHVVGIAERTVPAGTGDLETTCQRVGVELRREVENESQFGRRDVPDVSILKQLVAVGLNGNQLRSLSQQLPRFQVLHLQLPGDTLLHPLAPPGLELAYPLPVKARSSDGHLPTLNPELRTSNGSCNPCRTPIRCQRLDKGPPRTPGAHLAPTTCEHRKSLQVVLI